MDLQCMNCKFWKEYNEMPSMGICRRYAPRPVTSSPSEKPTVIEAVWPGVKASEWCGEWQAKIEVTEADS